MNRDELDKLRAICDEKYIGKMVKSFVNPGLVVRVAGFGDYSLDEDVLTYYYYKNEEDRFMYPICVYEKGRFAEIVPEESNQNT